MTSDPRRDLVRWARRRAQERGIEFSIDAEDVYIPRYCPVLGIPLVPGKGRHTDSSPSLDRIDPSKGYVPGNVMVLSMRANRIKSDATLEELVRVTAFIQQLKE